MNTNTFAMNLNPFLMKDHGPSSPTNGNALFILLATVFKDSLLFDPKLFIKLYAFICDSLIFPYLLDNFVRLLPPSTSSFPDMFLRSFLIFLNSASGMLSGFLIYQ